MKYWLHPAALEDLREAAEFYQERGGPSLSLALIAEFEHSVELVLRHPSLGALWRHGMRRLGIRRFPLAIIYGVTGDELRIVAVAHHSRRPGYWRGRR